MLFTYRDVAKSAILTETSPRVLYTYRDVTKSAILTETSPNVLYLQRRHQECYIKSAIYLQRCRHLRKKCDAQVRKKRRKKREENTTTSCSHAPVPRPALNGRVFQTSMASRLNEDIAHWQWGTRTRNGRNHTLKRQVMHQRWRGRAVKTYGLGTNFAGLNPDLGSNIFSSLQGGGLSV